MLDAKERIDDNAFANKGADKRGDASTGMMGAVKEKIHDVTDGAAEVVGTATDKVQEWAHDVGDAAVHAKDKAAEWAHDVGDAAVHVKDKAKEMASATADKAGEVGKEVTDVIRRYPIASLSVGVGVGFLLGYVLHSSSRRA